MRQDMFVVIAVTQKPAFVIVVPSLCLMTERQDAVAGRTFSISPLLTKKPECLALRRSPSKYSMYSESSMKSSCEQKLCISSWLASRTLADTRTNGCQYRNSDHPSSRHTQSGPCITDNKHAAQGRLGSDGIRTS